MVPVVVFPPTTPSTDQLTPLLLAENCCVWAEVTVAVRGLTVSAAAVPMPVRDAVVVLPPMPSTAVCVPVAVGAKTTLSVQLVPGARDAPHELVCRKDA